MDAPPRAPVASLPGPRSDPAPQGPGPYSGEMSPLPTAKARGARRGASAAAPAIPGRTVLVLGAGVAGLVAARELEAAGARVVVLEASARVGGRVRTFRGFSDGSCGELGGELLEGSHQELLDLARALGIRPVRVLRRGFGFRTARGEVDADWDAVAALLRPATRAFVRAGLSWASAAARPLARMSVDRWLRESGASADVRRITEGLVRGMLLGDPERLSLLQLASELLGGEGGPTAVFHRLEGGNDRLPKALADGLASPVRVRSVVRAVKTTADDVRVSLRTDGREETLAADAAVVALPVPPLRRVAFHPALPAPMRRALSTVRIGEATKTVLEFDRPFWRSPRGPAAFGTDLAVGAYWDGGEEQRGRPAVLSVLAGADLSLRYARVAPDRRAARVARDVPDARTAVLRDGESVSWEREPFAGGGYARFDVGFDPALRAELSRPVGRLAFAGEHTSLAFQGYVTGALESGRRAALDVRRALAGPYALPRPRPR